MEIALSVESRFDHLQDRLAAALDFEEELRKPTRGESVAMMEHVVHEAAEAARGLSFAKAVTGGRALRWAGGAMLVLVLAVGATAILEDDVGLWARRSLLLAPSARGFPCGVSLCWWSGLSGWSCIVAVWPCQLRSAGHRSQEGSESWVARGRAGLRILG